MGGIYAANYIGSNSGSGWTVQITIQNKLLGQDGVLYLINGTGLFKEANIYHGSKGLKNKTGDK